MEKTTQEVAETTKPRRGRKKGTTIKAAATKTTRRTKAAAATKAPRAPRKTAAAAAPKAPRKTTAGRKRGGRRKATVAKAAALPDSVMIALEVDGKQTMVSVASAKSLYASLQQLFG